MRRALKIVAVIAAIGFAAAAVPAQAALVMGDACSASTVSGATSTSVHATACAGYFGGNLLGGSPDQRADATLALTALGTPMSITQTTFDALTSTGTLGAGGLLSFGTPLSGQVVVGIHMGNVPGGAINDQTVFYLFNFLTPQTGITLTGVDLQKFSTGTLYQNVGAVPEPATWALMVLGFGGIGMAMRRRRRRVLAQIA